MDDSDSNALDLNAVFTRMMEARRMHTLERLIAIDGDLSMRLGGPLLGWHLFDSTLGD